MITEETSDDTWLRNSILVAAETRYCRLFFGLVDLILYNIYLSSVILSVKLKRNFLSPVLSSVFVNVYILCINSHCGLNLLVFPVTGVSIALWCKHLTLPARREKNGGVVLEKSNIVLLIWLLDKSLNYCIEEAWNFTVFADRRTRRIYQPCTVDGPHSSNNPVN